MTRSLGPEGHGSALAVPQADAGAQLVNAIMSFAAAMMPGGVAPHASSKGGLTNLQFFDTLAGKANKKAAESEPARSPRSEAAIDTNDAANRRQAPAMEDGSPLGRGSVPHAAPLAAIADVENKEKKQEKAEATVFPDAGAFDANQEAEKFADAKRKRTDSGTFKLKRPAKAPRTPGDASQQRSMSWKRPPLMKEGAPTVFYSMER